MCGSGSSIEVNEPTEEDIETDLNNLEATEEAEETVQTDTNDKSDSVSKESPAITIENIKPIDHYGTSSHIEIVDESTLRLFFNDFGGVVVFLCSYDFVCETQGTIRFITDLTLIETLDGVRRGYFVEMNPIQWKVVFILQFFLKMDSHILRKHLWALQLEKMK